MCHFGCRLLPSWRHRVADVILCLRPLLYVRLGSHVSPAEHDIIVSSATPAPEVNVIINTVFVASLLLNYKTMIMFICKLCPFALPFNNFIICTIASLVCCLLLVDVTMMWIYSSSLSNNIISSTVRCALVISLVCDDNAMIRTNIHHQRSQTGHARGESWRMRQRMYASRRDSPLKRSTKDIIIILSNTVNRSKEASADTWHEYDLISLQQRMRCVSMNGTVIATMWTERNYIITWQKSPWRQFYHHNHYYSSIANLISFLIKSTCD